LKPSSEKRSKLVYTSIVLALAWWLLAIVLHGRDHFLLNYNSLRIVSPMLEPFVSSYSINAIASGMMLYWIYLIRYSLSASHETRRLAVESQVLLAISTLPLLAWAAEAIGLAWSPGDLPSPMNDGWVSLWSVYWFAGWSGLSLARLGGLVLGKVEPSNRKIANQTSTPVQEQSIVYFGSIVLVSLLIALWWVWQSHYFYNSFMLGFNDFGHFMQRVSNTANGRGFLLETPVLPIFWDHFNPGLVLLVPLWKIYPDVTLAFYLQAGALAFSSWGIWFIARGLRCSQKESACWSLAWLCQPILGQMNLAYTYGWHPISLAIPLLLFAIAFLQWRRWLLASLFTLIALSMEEGVFVIVATYCASNALFYRSLHSKNGFVGRNSDRSVPWVMTEVPWHVWLLLSVLATVGFVLVFKLSGLAEFQTARFSSLGGTSLEVVASPVLRPATFWGQLVSSRNAFFVLGLSISCYLPALVRGWRTAIAIVPPLAVLLVWEHRPAASLAFQYSSILLPVFWLSSMQASKTSRIDSFDTDNPVALQAGLPSTTNMQFLLGVLHRLFEFNGRQAAFGALASAFLFSLFLGQFPFSSETLSDVRASSYSASLMELSTESDQPSRFPREAGSPDGDWIHGQLKVIKDSGLEVLATGRIASHLLGNREVETIGQYDLRKEKLGLLAGWAHPPIRHYRWLIVDRMETFQQNQQQTLAVEAEAVRNGFVKLEERFGVAIYRNDAGF